MAATWASTGIEASKEFEKEAAFREAKKDTYGKAWRFRLQPGEEGRITFVDGDLDADGKLLAFVYPEHTLRLHGKWTNFVCTERIEPCPICATGDEASRVAVLTVIDHRSSKSKDGLKSYQNQRRLFVAKHGTYLLLQSMATKRGGLSGVTLDAYRADENKPSVGSNFDFQEKNDPAALAKLFTHEVRDDKGVVTGVETDFSPINYDDEIIFRTAAELRALGFESTSLGMADSHPLQKGPGKIDFSGQL